MPGERDRMLVLMYLLGYLTMIVLYLTFAESPKVLRVADPLKSIKVSNGNSNHAVVDQPSAVVIETDKLKLEMGQMKAEIKGRYGNVFSSASQFQQI